MRTGRARNVKDRRTLKLEDADATPVVNTLTLTEVQGRTTLTLLTECPSQQVRDLIINSGMEGGMQEAWDLLEQVAISLR